MNAKRFKIISTILLAGTLTLFLVACGGGGAGEEDGTLETTSVEVTVGFPQSTGQFTPLGGTFQNVTSVTVDVTDSEGTPILDNAGNPITGVPLSQATPGVSPWTGTISDVPLDVALIFIGDAFDIDVFQIFMGQVPVFLTANNQTVTIELAHIGDPSALPRIISITLPGNIQADDIVPVEVVVAGIPDDVMPFVFTALDGGSFTPSSGTIPLDGSGQGTIPNPNIPTLTYTAPVSGIFPNTLRVTNSQGVSVEVDFNITVGSTTSVNVTFNPVVTAITVKRTGTDVTWTATVVDDGAQGDLRFFWSFAQTAGPDCPSTCSVAFTSASAITSTGVLAGYDETVEGTVSLAVTDGAGAGGTTTISFTLVAGQFPDNLVVEPGPSFPTNGLVAHYTFSGNANDVSGNANNGVLNGTPVFTTDRLGAASSALLLDGVNDFVEVPVAREANFDATAFTLYSVIQIPDFSRRNWIITKGSNFGNYTMEILGTSGKPAYANQTTGGNYSALISLSPVPTSQFIHIAVTVDAVAFKSYINGAPERTVSGPTPPLLNNGSVLIGASTQFGFFFKGIIDEILVYNRVLSAAEIADLHASLQ